MAIVVGTNSWITEVAANTYMGTRLKASDYWTDDAADNSPALITAYKRLVNGNRFSFPATATQIMKDAQCEFALYLLQHLPDEDIRMGLQSQYVVEAGIVKEKYGNIVQGIVYPAVVVSLLYDYDNRQPYQVFDIERDEEQETDYDAVGNLTRNT